MLYIRPLRTCRLQDVLKYIGEEAPAQHLPRSARGQHKPSASTRERPVPGSRRKARLSQHESATPTAPLLSPRSQPSPSSGATRDPAGEGGGGTAATRPFHPTQTAAASSARFPNAGGSRCVVQPGPERPEGARRHHQSCRAERTRRAPIPVRAGDHGPSGTAAEPRLSSHTADGNGAGEGGTRRVGNNHGRRTALPLRDRHRRHPARRTASRNNIARPALRHRPPPGHTPPARAPGDGRTHPRSDTETRTNRHGRTARTRAAVPLPVTVGGGSGGRCGSARSLTVTGQPRSPARPRPRPETHCGGCG